jgi:hypothetical protein
MSKERELLEKLVLNSYGSNGVPMHLIYELRELLAQPEQTEQAPKLDIYKDIFEDYKYLLNAFKNGADANDYSREIRQAESDIRKACNWLFPLPTDVIDDLAQKAFYAGVFDFRVFARELEKQHGIGFTDD